MAGQRDPWNPWTVIEKPPAEVVESATPAVTFFSNAGNLRLIECFLWLVWLLVVISLAVVARQIFICARRSVEDENAARNGGNGCSGRAGKKCDEEINEMETFSHSAVVRISGDGGGIAECSNAGEDPNNAARHPNGDFDSYDGSDAVPSTRVYRFWWRPWVLFRSHRDADVKTRARNIIILMGVVLFYCIICYVLTVVTIVTFVKMTEGLYDFGLLLRPLMGRGCLNYSGEEELFLSCSFSVIWMSKFGSQGCSKRQSIYFNFQLKARLFLLARQMRKYLAEASNAPTFLQQCPNSQRRLTPNLRWAMP